MRLARRRAAREGRKPRKHCTEVREDGFDTAIVADIHFVPEVCRHRRAKYVDKVRINPGNYRTDRGELEALLAMPRAGRRAAHRRQSRVALEARLRPLGRYAAEPGRLGDMEFLRVCRLGI